MKKNKLMSLLLIILFLTGCSNNKKIECSYYEELSSKKIIYDYILNFDSSGKILKNIELSLEMSFNNLEELNKFISDNQNNACKFIMSENFFNMNDLVSCESKKNGNNLVLSIKYKYEEMSKEQKDNLFSDITYDEFKANYETNNFSQDICTFDSNKKIEPVLYNDGIGKIVNKSSNSSADNSNVSDNNSANDISKVINSSANGILMSAETFVVTYMLEHDGEMLTDITFTCDGQMCSTDINGIKEKLDFKGTIPTSGSIYINSNGEASIKEKLIINGFTCAMNNDNVSCKKY